MRPLADLAKPTAQPNEQARRKLGGTGPVRPFWPKTLAIGPTWSESNHRTSASLRNSDCRLIGHRRHRGRNAGLETQPASLRLTGRHHTARRDEVLERAPEGPLGALARASPDVGLRGVREALNVLEDATRSTSPSSKVHCKRGRSSVAPHAHGQSGGKGRHAPGSSSVSFFSAARAALMSRCSSASRRRAYVSFIWLLPRWNATKLASGMST